MIDGLRTKKHYNELELKSVRLERVFSNWQMNFFFLFCMGLLKLALRNFDMVSSEEKVKRHVDIGCLSGKVGRSLIYCKVIIFGIALFGVI